MPPFCHALVPNINCVFADVIGVEICGSLKNVLAIAAGIVEGLELGPNAMAALVAQVLEFDHHLHGFLLMRGFCVVWCGDYDPAQPWFTPVQGCSEIRWLATKMGAKTATISGLSGEQRLAAYCLFCMLSI